jgi:tetratricopeptide (TPR) repeat protein
MRNAVVAYAQNYGDGQPGNYSKLAAEMDTFMATARWAEKLGDNSIATEIVVALDGAGDFINTCGYLYEQMELRALSSGTPQAFPAYQPEEELPLEASGFEEDMLDEDFDVDDDSERLEAIFISNVEEDDTGQVRVPVSEIVDLDTNDLAKLRSALAEVKQSGDSVQQIKVLKTIGSVQIEQDAEIEALATYSELLNTYETLDDDEGKLDAIDMLSSLLVKTDNPQAAVMHATRGVKLAHDLGDEDTQTQILITLGDAHQQLGEGGKAVENYSDALSMTRSRNDAQNEAIALYKLGYAQLDDGDPDTAIHTWEQALQLFRKHNKRNYESRVLGGLGSAHSDLQHWPEAVNYHSSALHIAREVGNSEEEALQLSSLAYAALQAEQLGEAVLRYRQALHLAYESEDEDTIISTIVALARLLLRSRRHVSVAELIVNDGLELERTDKELYQLKERIIKDKVLANSQGLEMIEVHGTARTYALNAYKLLGE